MEASDGRSEMSDAGSVMRDEAIIMSDDCLTDEFVWNFDFGSIHSTFRDSLPEQHNPLHTPV